MYIGMMENNIETTIVYWGYVGIMENTRKPVLVCKTMPTLSPQEDKFRLQGPTQRCGQKIRGLGFRVIK